MAKAKKVIEKANQALEVLQVETVPIDSVTPNPWNPNRQSEHDFALLIRSMKEDGFTQPIVVVRLTEAHLTDPKFGNMKVGDTVIVDGEHRWRAAMELGHTEIPVVPVPMLAEQMRIATLRHNRARGSEDVGLAADVLRDLQTLGALDWAQDSLMLDDTELNLLLNDISIDNALAAEEFSAAWEPDKNEVERFDHPNRLQTASVTSAASDLIRQRELALAKAKTAEEQARIRKDMAIYRITLTFTDEEAEVVRSVLEPNPVNRLLGLCRAVYQDPNLEQMVETPADLVAAD